MGADRAAARPRRTTRGVRAATLALAASALLAGCAGEVITGEAYPDWDAVDARAAEAFDAQMALLSSSIEASSPFRTDSSTDAVGVSYAHATFGDRDTASQSVVAVQGNPASIFIQQTDADEGYTIDTLHVGGDSVDYLLLGEAFSSLATTPWVSVPTVFGEPGESDLVAGLRTMCFIDGFQKVCEIYTVIQMTQESEQGATARRTVTVDDDGSVFSETEVTLRAVVEQAGLLDMPEDLTAELTDEMLDSFIPVSLWQDADGNLQKMEMNGTVRGTDGVDDLVVQVGFEITGKASATDFPAPPAAADVSRVREQDEAFFYEELGRLQ